MKTPRKALFIIVPLAIFLLPIAIYLADRSMSQEQVARNVTVAGVAVGGLDRADAMLAVQSYEQELKQSTGVFTVNSESFKLNPLAIGLTASSDAAVTEAMTVRRDGNPFTNFFSWIDSFSTVEDVPLKISFSDTAIDAELDDWEQEAIPNPAYEGTVAVVDGEVEPEYPREGEQINRPSARLRVKAEMSTLDKSGVDIAVAVASPIRTNDNVDAAAAEMRDMIDSEITLTADEVGFETIFSPEQLASAVRALRDPSKVDIEIVFDAETVVAILDPRRSEFEVRPISARYYVDLSNNHISVIPGRYGTLIDIDGLLIEMKRVGLGRGVGVFPLLVGDEPRFTTEEAESYTDLGLIAQFTTKHPANQDRVTNIQQMARDVDDSLVHPGQEWSINDRVGERKEADGYVAAPAIINGAPYCCDHPANIGGGVSQFGTTMFNAIFYACLEDVEHRPHSLYFTRYPEGREATLGYPHPDVRFRNNTDAPVIIKTAYTSTSVTVKLFGNNGDKDCDDVTHDREDLVEYEDELIADEEGTLSPGERVKERSGINGFLIRVDRVVTMPDGSQNTDLNLVWRYAVLSQQYKVHPCEVSGEPVNCPVKTPSVRGLTWEAALSSLQDVGLLAAKATESVDDAAQDGIVISQDPGAGKWVNRGSTITLTVGVYSGAPPVDPPGDG